MNRHPRLIPLCASSLILAATFFVHAEARKAAEKKVEKTPNYYPLQLGNTWHFRLETPANVVDLVSTIAKIEKIDDVLLARLEASINDKVIATEHLRQTDQGVFRYRAEGKEISPPICLLKYPVKSGSKWNGNTSVGNQKMTYACEAVEETVEVKAGKFKTMRVSISLDTEGTTVNTTYWFVPDVGFVKQSLDVNGQAFLMQLEKFEPAKAKQK